MKTKTAIAFIAFLLIPSICAAGAIGLSKTGQTTSYAAGDDGALQAGVSWPDPRFSDNGDGTITDNLTGLMWLKDANPDAAFELGSLCIPGYCPGMIKWQDALDLVAAINGGSQDMSACKDYTADYTDWRLPNVNEYESLLNAESTDIASWLISQGFFNAGTYAYWSSTSVNDSSGGYPPSNVWVLDMSGTQNSYIKITGKNNAIALTWLVRNNGGRYPCETAKTGQTICYDTAGSPRDCTGTGEDGELQKGVAWPAPRFTDNSDGTVTDNLSGLIWLKDITGLGNGDWTAALAKVVDLNASPDNYRTLSGYTANYNDWRLPNKREIMSLVDYSEPSVTPVSILPRDHPFVNVVSGGLAYWTASSWAPQATSRAWNITLKFGTVFSNDKAQNAYIWPVRGVSDTPPPPPPPGDVDGDGMVGLKDAIISLKISAGLPGPPLP